ncbi:relaxase domain-containing protein [Nocardia amamiensis]|uniref:Relaxase domain-containing protein n=1 Tax=Nocardia amamiensis TaxID=404578 RepID=A0ABS0D4Z8_9NOCA|nr:MobF family relaxase [Nocardia amamiensis]MBF6302249.1 relaxase domain-containing protein [Nocardia amamiensis]
MTLHKLAAGEGYLYYARCIAVGDGDDRGRATLADYYEAKGEAPGRWIGSGLVAFAGIEAGDAITEAQMAALFGEGRHPDAAAITARLKADGVTQPWVIRELTRLGRPFYRYRERPDFRRECAVAIEAWNIEQGNPRDEKVPEEVLERIRTEVALRMFTAEHERAPKTDTELSGWISRNLRPPKVALAAVDLTFSPAKSVSAVWAVAPREVAEKIEAAHYAAIRDALAYLEKHAVYTRLGACGVRQVDTEGIIAAAYTHRDSRAGDPDLHTHVVVSAKVRTLDGSWRAIDSSQLYLHNVAASEVYNTRLEAYLGEALELAFAERPGQVAGKRPVREIVGVAAELNELWSKRNTEITARVGAESSAFQARHQREPMPKEVLRMAGTATIATRARKHAPRALIEQRAAWWAEAVQLLGEQRLEAMLAHVLAREHDGERVREFVDEAWIDDIARRVIATVSESRATWRIPHVRAEAERQMRGRRIDVEQLDEIVERVIDTALAEPISIPRGVHDTIAAPGVLARRDGTSVYVTAGSTLYTSPQVLAAERRLLKASTQYGGRTISAAAVEVAEVEYAANNQGRRLNPGQRALVQAFATSGARLQVAIAPAGTGKTTAMQVLVRAWRAEGGSVIGLAPTSAAAGVLEQEAGVSASTIDLLVTVAADLESGVLDELDAPEWVRSIDERTLVILDEAAKASTANLDAAVAFLLRRGASIRAIGDDQQLASVAAGGVMRDIAHTSDALTLTTVMRFADAGERAASLAVRDGDPAGLAFYADRDRIHVGTIGSVTEQAFAAWAADNAAGLDSLLLAPTRDLVSELNARARAQRLSRTPLPDDAREVVLSDGLAASVGDTIVTRRNNYSVRISATDFVRNGYRWVVREVHPDGRITAAHTLSGRLATLDADYVREHVQLGYASTIDSSQGLTVDTCHGLMTRRAHRGQVYVVLTRGRSANHIYIETGLDPAGPAAYTIDAVHPPTYLDVLTEVLNRRGGQVSASTGQREAEDPRRRLQAAVGAYADSIGVVAEHLFGARARADIDAAADRLVPGLTDESAYPTLRQHLWLRAAQGDDPVALLTEAVAARELDTATDRAAVLHWRIGDRVERGPLPWLPTVPAALRGDPEYGAALAAREDQVQALAAEVAQQARSWTEKTAPMWARPLVGADAQLLEELAVWRAARGIADNDRRRTGPAVRESTAQGVQVDLDRRAAAVLGHQALDVRRWKPLVDSLDPKITSDPYWPTLAAELSRAAATGVDVPAAVRAAVDERALPVDQPAAALRWRLAPELDERSDDKTSAFGAVLDELRGNKLRRMTDTELARQVEQLRNQVMFDHTAPALTGDKTGQAVAETQRAQQRRVEQAAAIRRAQELDAELVELRQERYRIGAALQAEWRRLHEANKWQVLARRKATNRIAELEKQLEEHDKLQDPAQKAADAVALKIVEPKHRWSQVIAEADDPRRHAAELDAAADIDRKYAKERAEAIVRADNSSAELDAALDEQRRRTEQADPERDLEDRARAELKRLGHPAQPETAAAAKKSPRRQSRTTRAWDPGPYRDIPSIGPSHGSGPGYGL